MTRDEIIKMAREAWGSDHEIFWFADCGIERFAALVAAAEREAKLMAENEANERNLCQLTDELAKTVTLLRQAWAVIRWQCFGECRTEGVEGLPTPSEVDIAIREHLNKSKQ